MPVYSYLIYCANEGASHSNPLRPIYSEEEILERLRFFNTQSNHCFSPAVPEIENIAEGTYDFPLPAVKVTIISDDNEAVIEKALACSVRGLDLSRVKL